MPAYVLVLLYSFVALFFPDRWNYLCGLCLVIILWMGCRSLGRRILNLSSGLPDSWLFPAGLGLVLGIASILFSISASVTIIFVMWGFIAALAVLEFRFLTMRLSWAYAVFTPLILLAFWSSFTPTTFYDALAYHLGLPYQYFAHGKMSVLPNQLFSTFPPFEQTLNLLFVGTGCLSGIKLSSLILYLSLIHVFSDLIRRITSEDFRSQIICWILLLLPAPWILIQLITADLLVALFFCCSIAALINASELPPKFQILIPSAFLSFTILTKLNCLPYILFLPLLALILKSEKNFSEKLKRLTLQALLILLFVSPFLLRNYLAMGDPLYPALKKVFQNSAWTDEQQLALRQDSFSKRKNILVSIIETPALLSLRKGNFGAAAQPGFILFIGTLMYLFVRKNPVVNRILIYFLISYVAWLIIFASFRQALPVFLLLALPSAISFHALYKRSAIIFGALLLLISLDFIVGLIPVFSKFFPLINPQQTQSAYLRANLDYYPSAEKMNALNDDGKILLLGETRAAYINRKTIIASRYNYNPLYNWVHEARDVNDLVQKLQKEEVNFIFCNWREYTHVIVKSGILYLDLLPPRFRDEIPPSLVAQSGAKIHTLNERDAKILRQFLSSYPVPIWLSDGKFFLYKLRFEK